MNSYIVVENQTDKELVRRLFPQDLLDKIYFVTSSGKSAAVSLCRSILSTRQMPTVLIVDSNTTNEHEIREQRTILDDLLRIVAGATPYHIEFAIPEIECIFFSDIGALEAVIGVKLSEAEEIEARYRPQKVLLEVIGRSKINSEMELISMLSQEAIAKFAVHPLAKNITRFLYVTRQLKTQAERQPAA